MILFQTVKTVLEHEISVNPRLKSGAKHKISIDPSTKVAGRKNQ